MALTKSCVEYLFIGDQAFTKDKILIYNLFIESVRKDVTAPQLLKHFQKFGEVLDVILLKKENLSSNKCFIHFTDPEVAAKVLKMKDFDFMGVNIRIEACDGLDQPDGQRLIKQLDGFLNTDLLAQATDKCNSSKKIDQISILTLNDDCLEHILRKLHLTDQINFALTCQRFCAVLKMRSRVDYSNLNNDFFSGWTLLKMRIFLQIVGPQIKTLEIKTRDTFTSDDCALIKFFGLFCTSVKKLKVESAFLSSNEMQKLIKKMQLLQELDLEGSSLNDKFIKYLKTYRNLKNLNLSDWNTPINNIKYLRGLETLTLKGCCYLTPQTLKNICENLKSLNYLDIIHCQLLNAEDFKHISEHLQQLKTLKFSGPEGNFNSIAQLPRLKQLEIKGACENSPVGLFLNNLAKYQANQLEELTLDSIDINLENALSVTELKKLKIFKCKHCDISDTNLDIFTQLTQVEEITLNNCHFITNKAVLQLLEKCLQLNRINLECCGKILTPELVRNANKLLQEQHAQGLRTDRVRMRLRLRNYTDAIKKDIAAIEIFPDILETYYEYEYHGHFEIDNVIVHDFEIDNDDYLEIENEVEDNDDHLEIYNELEGNDNYLEIYNELEGNDCLEIGEAAFDEGDDYDCWEIDKVAFDEGDDYDYLDIGNEVYGDNFYFDTFE